LEVGLPGHRILDISLAWPDLFFVAGKIFTIANSGESSSPNGWFFFPPTATPLEDRE